MHFIQNIITLFVILIFLVPIDAQQDITMEELFEQATYSTKRVPSFRFMKDGRHYTKRVGDRILQYDIKTGKETKEILNVDQLDTTLFHYKLDGYTFSEDETKLLLKTQTQKIFRRSSLAHYFVYDLGALKLTEIDGDEKQRDAHFNLQGTKIAFVQNNDLYYMNISTRQRFRVTTDGKKNEIINGVSDWVYEEEFGITRMFEWSPNGDKLGFVRFDESAVEEFIVTNYRDKDYPEYVKFKYPKVGAKNSDVSVFIHDTESRKTIPTQIDSLEDVYIPRIKWTKDNNQLCVFKMNRHQNNIKLLLIDAIEGSSKTLFEETNKAYIDIHNNLTFTSDGRQFIWTSEQDGYNHIYLYDMQGQLQKQLTKGQNEVTSFYGLDEKRQRVYYQKSENGGLDRSIYSIGLDGNDLKVVAAKQGVNSAKYSTTFDYYIYSYSNANTPPIIKVKNNKKRDVRLLEDNTEIIEFMRTRLTVEVDITAIPNSHGDFLNTAIIKPAKFDPNKKYPLLMFLYGGPGSQRVKNSFNSYRYYWWFQMLAQQGYMIAVVDNRGTGGRGEAFKKMTYLQLGKYETEDQIDAARYLGNLPYVDESKIGIFGWSYGGYMSSLCLFKGADVFKYAIAVAPVTNWKWYDSIYTERYMRTKKENPSGYRDNSPVYFTDKMKGNYLLVHGLSDDNVHFQHSAEITKELIKNKKQFDTYLYPNRNHSIYGDNARIHLFTKITDFIHRQ